MYTLPPKEQSTVALNILNVTCSNVPTIMRCYEREIGTINKEPTCPSNGPLRICFFERSRCTLLGSFAAILHVPECLSLLTYLRFTIAFKKSMTRIRNDYNSGPLHWLPNDPPHHHRWLEGFFRPQVCQRIFGKFDKQKSWTILISRFKHSRT